jgi:hypothetical protein
MSKGMARTPSAITGVVKTARARGRAVRTSTEQTFVTSRRVAVWLGGFSLLCFGYFAPHNDAGQNARTDMAVAIVDHRAFTIDAYGTNTTDKIQFRGHYYSNKAPGLSIAAVPVYLLYKGFSALHGGSLTDSVDDPQLRYLESFCLSTIPATLLLLLFFWFLGYYSPSLVNRVVLTLFLGLGTIMFPYSENFYAHVSTAGLLFAGFVLIYLVGSVNSARRVQARWLVDNPENAAFLAGLAVGTAVLLEYPSAVIAILIATYALSRLPWKSLLHFIVGVLPPLALLSAYNYAVFGSAFALGPPGAPQQVEGAAGFTWPPALEATWGMSFSPDRGMFFLSPFLLLAFPGFLLWKRRHDSEWRLFLSIPLVYFLVIAMYSSWRGGWAVGPRYLIPMLPFLTLPAIFTLDALTSSKIPRDIAGVLYALVYGAFSISIVATGAESISAAGGLWPDASNPNPLFSSLLPTVLEGGVLGNQGTMQLGISGATSLLPLVLLLALWSLLMYTPPLLRWVNESSGWLPPGERASWASWRRRIARTQTLAPTMARLQRTKMHLRSASSGALPPPPLVAVEAHMGVRPEYAVLRRPDAGWQLALCLTIALRVGLGLVGAWAVIAHGAIPAGAWTNLIIQDGKSWSDVLSSWQRWDALWYQQIAQNGYHAGNNTYQFGPLYPLLVHILSLVLGGTTVVAELIISSLAFMVAMFLLYCVARLKIGPVSAALTVLLLAFFPTGFLLLAPYSEGMLLALTLLAFWLAHNERPWAAGVAGLCAALVQSIGVLIVLPLIVEYLQYGRVRGRRLDLGLFSALLPILGLLIVNAYLRFSIGETHWYLPWDIGSRVPGNPVIPRGDPIEVINVICLAGFVILAIKVTPRLPTAYAVYMWPLLGLLIGSELHSPLTSMAHFAFLMFPCFMILAIWLVRRPALAAGWLMLNLLTGAMLLVYWVRFAFLG